ncbi:non-ribosomal peptide synthase domain TIGR01720/amino acid adenylation domain-containing protein [Seinonella peptonophila]|uniref:Non-ribosomal peptide synthase domain TIGR01720/amino acid adenylation domain-containing protein n=1 Tax=Seinonella peptonophila TaxID=112248 RepID=A0A1M5BEC8_9BACL|nr:non-ribosomal peptide synthetase [Seinonella peptonophila]SHF40806.1 non-ribosomal peptide synthase domain TIGR01720/amino acid adenylation domain-containing protein [Seinonella peptonophila]
MLMEEIQDLYALSPLQQGMLFHSAYAENSGMYVTQLAVKIKGPLDVAAFDQAWQQVLNRHSIFRTGFIWGETEQPLQIVYRTVESPFQFLDWSQFSEMEQKQKIEEFCYAERMKDFVLTEAPLMRIYLIRLDEQVHQLVWTYHHVLMDGWSLPIVLQELFSFYEANRNHEQLSLAKPRPYHDYIKWLRDQDQSELKAFWEDYLAGFESPTLLKLENFSIAKGKPEYQTIHAHCDRELSHQVQNFAKQRQITVNTLVQAAWALLLSHYSGEEEVVFGTTVSGRPAELPGVEQMVGLFINTLPIRIVVDEELTIFEWLQKLQQESVKLRKYEHTSLLEVQNWSQVPKGTPLFDTLYVFENYPVQESTADENQLQFADVISSEQTNYPLTLVAAPGDQISLKLMFDQTRYQPKVVQRMLADLQCILQQLVTQPKIKMDQVSIFTEADRRQWENWNQTEVDFPAHKTIHQLIEGQVYQTPDQIALYDGERQFTYLQVERQANQLAHQLQSLGVCPGDRVGVCLQRSAEMVMTLLAILKTGAAYVPLDPAYPQQRIQFMLSDAQVAALVTEAALVDLMHIYTGPALLIDQREVWSVHPTDPPSCEVESDALAYLIYTSGSTGKPKGVMIEHRQAVALISWAGKTFSATELAGVLASTSICFDLSVFEMFVPLVHGGAVHIAENALALARLTTRDKITLINTVPSAAGELVRQEAIPNSVETINLAGEALNRSLVDKLYQSTTVKKVYNLYGPSEDTTYSTFTCVARNSNKAPTIGRPIHNSVVYVLDRNMQQLPVGIAGELYLAGAGVTRGYWQRDELTRQRYLEHPKWGRLYRTGDLVRYLESGELQFLGRADDQVKVRGFRIELGEIEEAIRQHPLVNEAAVIVTGERMEERSLIAYVVSESIVEWRAYLRDRLPEYMIPNHFIQLERLPLTPNGKLDRRALPKPSTEVLLETKEQNESPLEQIVTGIWCDVLQRESIDRDEHFFELGGHSLLATQVISRIESALQMQLPLRILFEAPTIHEFVQVLERYRKEEFVSLPRLEVQQLEGNESPLSFAQQRVWFIEQMSPGEVTYQMPFALRIKGKLDVAGLDHAIQRMVMKHEILRTTFTDREGEAIQVIHPEGKVRLEQVTLTNTDPETELAIHMQQEMNQPFDLVQGPLFRVYLYTLSNDEHVLFVHMHHLITDGWSTGIWMKELFATDSDKLSDSLPIQYKDFAIWQRNWMQEESYTKQLQYWKEKLDQLPILELPLDYSRPKEQTFTGNNVTFTLDPQLTEELEKLSRSEDVTLYMTLLAAYKLLLYRYTGQKDLVVGTPIANRQHQALEQLIGFFVNTLALRTDLSGELTCRELLERVRQTALQAYAHQDVPFEKIVDELQLERDLSHTPIFQTMFVFQNIPTMNQSIDRLEISPYELEHTVAKFDLTMTLMENENQGLTGNIEYNLDLFKESTVKRMMIHFQEILKQLVEDPDQSIESLQCMTQEECDQLLRWSEHQHPLQANSIAEEFEKQVRRAPDQIALRQEDVSITYQALNQEANRIAHRLRQLGVGRDTLVGLYLKRSPQLYSAMLGILKAGGAYVPFDLNDPTQRLHEMIQSSGLQFVITSDEHEDRFRQIDVQLLQIDKKDQWSQLDTNPQPVQNGDDRAYVMYTSGSTGKPKGVEVTHRGVLRLVIPEGYAEFGPEETFLQLAPVAFDASTFEIWGCLLHGGTLVIMPPETPSLSKLAEVIQQESITTLWLTVGLFNLMVEHHLHALAGLRQLLVGGDIVSPSHVKKVLSLGTVTVINGYGPTENTTFTCCYPIPHDWSENGSVPIGRPVANTRVYVLNEQQQLQPIGVPGELWVGGDGLARGYLGQPELTEERFIDHPKWGRLYRTGDQVRYLADGNLEFLGRLDQQVKLRGYRIEQGEIEEVLRSHEAVKEATVIVDDQRLYAYLLGNEVQDISYDEWRNFLQTRLPDYMIPSAFIPVHSIPLTRNGKVDRQRLPKPDSSLYHLDLPFEAPRNEIEEQLLIVWKEVLGIESINIHDNFFRLGGDSILSIQIVAKCKRYGLQLSPKKIFEYQSIAELAKYVQVQQDRDEERPEGEVSLLPIQKWFFDQEIEPRNHWNQAMMLTVSKKMLAKDWKMLIHKLVAHHDALRLRFKQEQGTWKQWYQSSDDVFSSEWIDLHELSKTQQLEAIKRIAQRTQTQLDLQEGPLFRAVYFHLGEDQIDQVLLVAHHLVIDGVSWRILLDDLESLSEGYSLPPRTTSYQRWSESLTVDKFEHEQPYWTNLLEAGTTQIPKDHSLGANREASTELVSVQLDEQETEQLLQQVRIPTTEILLTAFADTMGEWMKEESLLIHLEGHGREELDEQIDLSRTVGWFTSLYPMRLMTNPLLTQKERLTQVRKQMKEIPGHGIGYGILRYRGTDLLPWEPLIEVSFNYLGQFTAQAEQKVNFQNVSQEVGEMIDPNADRPYLLDIIAVTSEGKLSISWKYSKNIHRRETIQQLAEQMIMYLRSLLRNWESWLHLQVTQEDFPLATIDPAILLQRVEDSITVENLYPVTPLQQGMIFHSLYSQHQDDYITQICFQLRGKLSVDRLHHSWQTLIQRHASLRTGFIIPSEGEPHQVVYRKVDCPLEIMDWRNLTETEQKDQLNEQLCQERLKGFAFAAPPLMRLLLIRIGEDQYQLIWTHHHVLLDGWSIPLLIQEWLMIDQGLELPPVQNYGEYIAWLKNQERGEAKSFWRKQLQGFTSPIRIPTDREHQKSASPGEVKERLSVELSEGIKRFAREQRVTLNTVLQGAWGLLLRRLTGQSDLIYGVTSSGRPADLSGVEQMIGLFINTLPIRLQINDELGIGEWLRGLQAQQSEMRQFDYLPLVDIQECSDVPSGVPLFDTLFVFENYPLTKMDKESNHTQGFSLEEVQAFDQSHFPFTVVTGPGEQVYLKITYDQNRYSLELVEQYRRYYQHILRQMVLQPIAKLSEITLLTKAEEQQLLVEWNCTEVEYARDSNVAEQFSFQAVRTPGAIALMTDQQQLTYQECEEKSNQWAHLLIQKGVKPGDRIGVALGRSVDFVLSILAILKVGAAYVPFDTSYPAATLKQMIDDTTIDLVLTDPDRCKLFEDFTHCLLVNELSEQVTQQSKLSPSVSCNARDLAYIMFTSGSTGKPKGVAISHRSILRLVQNVDYAELTADHTFLLLAPTAFDASTFELWGSLLNGARLAIMTEEKPTLSKIATAIEEYQVTTLWLTAGLFALMADHQLSTLCQLQQLLVGGDVVSVNHVQKVLAAGKTKVVNGYGPTESTTFACCYQVPRDFEGYALPIGRPIANTQVYVLDERQQPVPIGTVGELYIGGDGLSLGYWNQEALTKEVFVRHPYSTNPTDKLYRTGDLVRYLPNGELMFIGRRDQQVKVRGYRVERTAIEHLLLQHEHVQEAVVIVDQQKQLIAYVMGSATEEELKSHVQKRLPIFMVPAQIIRLDRLPLTPNGKVDHRALPKPMTTQERMQAKTEVEKRLVEMWAEILEIDHVGIDDHFFALGGHSFHAMRLMAMIEEHLDISLPLSTLFEAPTIRELALHLEQKPDKTSSLVCLQQGDKTIRPLFLIHPQGGGILSFAPLVSLLASELPVYGLQSIGYEGEEPPLATIEMMAERYCENIRTIQPKGPYRLLGWSFGGCLAVEMARYMESVGEEIEWVGLIDSTWLPHEQKQSFIESITHPETIQAQAQSLGVETTSPKVVIWMQNGLAYASYQPTKPVKADLYLFRAADHQATFGCYDWSQLTTGIYQQLECPGDHTTMLSLPHVKHLAIEIRKLTIDPVQVD